MRIRLITQNISLADWKRDLLQRRTERALARLAHRIESVSVSFEDLNGPRGGEDTQCRIRLQLLPRGEINASAVDTSAYLAFHGALQRVKRQLSTLTPALSRMDAIVTPRRTEPWNSDGHLVNGYE